MSNNNEDFDGLVSNILDSQIDFVEKLSRLDISNKIPRKELLLQLRKSYSKQLKKWDIKMLEQRLKHLNGLFSPMIKDMINVTNQEIESKGSKSGGGKK
jgi:hypothetical protein